MWQGCEDQGDGEAGAGMVWSTVCDVYSHGEKGRACGSWVFVHLRKREDVRMFHVIRNCVKTTTKPRLSWEWSVRLVRFLFLYHLQHTLNPIHHDWLNSSTKTLLHLSEKLLKMSMDILWMGLWWIYREYGWWKNLVRRENRGLTGVYHAKFNCLISEEEHLGFILRAAYLHVQTQRSRQRFVSADPVNL